MIYNSFNFNLQSISPTKEDFYIYFGEHIENYINDVDNTSNQVNGFLTRCEIRFRNYLQTHYATRIMPSYDFRATNATPLSEYQMTQYRIAVLEQVMYELRNGDLWTDSGYSVEQGMVAKRESIKRILVSQTAINALMASGIINARINNINACYMWGYYGF